VPSDAFVQKLKAAGVIHHASISKAVWDATIGAVEALIEWAKYTAGFVIGLLEGAWNALKDLFTGVWDLIKAFAKILKAIFTDWDSIKTFGKKLAALWENRSDILDAIAADFQKKWDNPDDYDRGNFQGEVLGYVMMTAFIMLVTLGSGAAAMASGRLGAFIKLIQFADKAGDITFYIGKLAKAVKLPAKVVGEATDALKGTVSTAAKVESHVPHVPHVDAPHVPHVDAPPVGAPNVPPTLPHVSGHVPDKPPHLGGATAEGAGDVFKHEVFPPSPAPHKGGQLPKGAKPAASGTPKPRTRTPDASRRRGFTDVGAAHKSATADPGRSLTDTAGHTASEAAEIAKEIVSDVKGRIERSERHHSVFVFVLRAIQAKRAGRKVASVTAKGGEGFRQIVDALFPQKLVELHLPVHNDLHRAVNDILDEMLEPEKVINLIERKVRPESFGAGWKVVERGGAKEMMRRLNQVTERELVEIVDEAYRRAFREHPGLVSDEIMKKILDDIDSVKRALGGTVE
jgi:hypothetical protein